MNNACAPARLLGPSSWCTVEDSQLVLELTQSGTLQPGDTLTVKAGQKQLVDKLQAGALFGGSVVVSNCLTCSSPIATIVGPKVSLLGFSAVYRQHS